MRLRAGEVLQRGAVALRPDDAQVDLETVPALVALRIEVLVGPDTTISSDISLNAV